MVLPNKVCAQRSEKPLQMLAHVVVKLGWWPQQGCSLGMG